MIIHEVFDGKAPPERGERELDKAMIAKHSTIVIEPHHLGNYTSHTNSRRTVTL